MLPLQLFVHNFSVAYHSFVISPHIYEFNYYCAMYYEMQNFTSTHDSVKIIYFPLGGMN